MSSIIAGAAMSVMVLCGLALVFMIGYSIYDLGRTEPSGYISAFESLDTEYDTVKLYTDGWERKALMTRLKKQKIHGRRV